MKENSINDVFAADSIFYVCDSLEYNEDYKYLNILLVKKGKNSIFRQVPKYKFKNHIIFESGIQFQFVTADSETTFV